MATAETAPLPSGLPEGGWAALLDRIKGGDDSGALEPLSHQLYAAVSSAGPPPPLAGAVLRRHLARPGLPQAPVAVLWPCCVCCKLMPVILTLAGLQGLADPAEAAAVIAS